MGFFKQFIESELSLGAMRRARKGLGKTYQPGTFGIEIEFRASPNDNYDQDIDLEHAHDIWEREQRHNIPENPKEWRENNQEPEEPDRDDYAWSDTDPMVNYWNLDMERAKIPVPETIHNYKQGERLFSSLPEIPRRFVLNTIQENAYRIINLLIGGGDTKYKYDFFVSKDEFSHFLYRLEMAINIVNPDSLLHQVNNMWRDVTFDKEQYSYLKELFYAIWDAIKTFEKFHIERAKAITEEEYKEKIEEVWDNDYETWRDEYKDWKKEYKEIKEKWDNWDEDREFHSWLDQNIDRFYNDSPNIENEIEEIKYWFRSQKQKVTTPFDKATNIKTWNVFEDESGVIEITSPILKVGDFWFLKRLLGYLSDKEFDSNTGCHIHIGMPPLTDSFDLLSVASLLDEESILDMSGREESSLDRYANRKDKLFSKLANIIGSKIITVQELQDILDINIGRYYGVNLIDAFNKYGTVELRYLTSQIVTNPEQLFKVINYFLMLPRLAQSRNQIRHDFVGGTIIASRRPGAKVEFSVFLKNDSKQHLYGITKSLPIQPSLPQTALPVPILRQEEEPGSLKDKLRSKFTK